MLITTQEMFKKAYAGKYAIWWFNVNNMEIIQWIMEAAKNKKSAVILQVSAWARKYANPIFLKHLVDASVEIYPEIPIALHLDHWDNFDICKSCIDSWFSSVMIDASKYDLEENIKITKKVVDYAHSIWVVVEAELWRLEGIEDDINVSCKDASFTQVKDVVKFVKQTNCDSLAISIWTSHWAFKFQGDPFLDYQRLKDIGEAVYWFPLVLHWASTVIPEFVDLCNKYGGKVPWAKWVPESMIWEAVKYWICKVNIDTDLRLAMTATIRKEFVNNPSNFDPRKYLGPAREAVKQLVMHKLDVLGNVNRI